MCVKNISYNGCPNGVRAPTSYTAWVLEHVKLRIGKMNTPLRKEFPVAPIKKMATLELPTTFADMLTLHAYHQIQKYYTYPNYDVIPNILEIGKQSPYLNWFNLCKLCKHPLSMRQIPS